ncbi:MAG: DUF5655 domain-containing protein [Gemmatimonadota bacterium]
MWRCPKCGRRFANRNQWHSCGPFTVEGFLEGKGHEARTLFEAFVRAARECGPLTLAPAKTRVGLQVRTIFAAVNSLGPRGLRAHLILPRRVESPRITRIETLGPRTHVHHFTVRDVAELDGEVRGWLQEAYRTETQP